MVHKTNKLNALTPNNSGFSTFGIIPVILAHAVACSGNGKRLVWERRGATAASSSPSQPRDCSYVYIYHIFNYIYIFAELALVICSRLPSLTPERQFRRFRVKKILFSHMHLRLQVRAIGCAQHGRARGAFSAIGLRRLLSLPIAL
jgi:hypothetical protein